MPTIVIGTTLLAALLHACWNALAKGAADKHLSMAGVIIGHGNRVLWMVRHRKRGDLCCVFAVQQTWNTVAAVGRGAFRADRWGLCVLLRLCASSVGIHAGPNRTGHGIT